jgi:hypothetical protein
MSYNAEINNKSSIIIKKNWDYAPHIDDIGAEHCHIIRKREQEILVDFFYRKREGALLVSGKRGVGKTSAIF